MVTEMTKRYRRSSQAEESQVGDRSVLYHRSSRKAVVLNPTGAVIWRSLTTPQTVVTLAEYLRSQFPSVTEDQAKADVSAFLQELLSHELIVAGG
jgi:hypothetical protein